MAKPMTIILVDDDIDDRQLFKRAMEDLNMDTQLLLMESGMELLNYTKDAQNVLPSIIFLDLNMPNKNGIECLIDLRKEDRYKNVSVAIYSTSDHESDIEKTFVNGANIYIIKPFNYKQLKTAIKKVLRINWQYYNSALSRESFLLLV